jgi:hypothetical protein
VCSITHPANNLTSFPSGFARNHVEELEGTATRQLLGKESSQGLERIFYSALYGTCLKFCFVDELLQGFVVWFLV